MTKQRLVNYFSKHDYRQIILRVFAVSFAFKIIMFFTLNYFHNTTGSPTSKEGIFVYGIDTKSYFNPIENTINKKEYSLDGSATAFRMPGLAPIYGPLYAIFSPTAAKQLFIFFQILADTLTACFIFILLFRVIATSIFFSLLGWGIYLFSTFVSSYNHYGLTETFATFSCVCFMFYFIKFTLDQQFKYIFTSGILLCWFIFLKPIAIIFLIIAGLILIFICFKGNSSNRIKLFIVSGLLLFSPFVLFDGIWTMRNYEKFHKTIPLTSVFDNTGARFHLKTFFRTTSLSFQSFSGNDHMTWFSSKNDKSYDKGFSESNPFPDRIFTSKCNFDSLKNLRSLYWKILEEKDVSRKNSNELIFKNRIESYVSAFKKEKTFQYYVTVNIINLRDFLFVKTIYNLPFTGSNVIQKIARGLYLLLYYIIILSFLLFTILYSFYNKKNKSINVLLTFSWLFILAHIILGSIENRYLVPIYPIILLLSVLCCEHLFRKWIRKKDLSVN